jgi:hypothetical protein
MLLSKALRMQQDLEDKRNEIIIEGFEKKIKDHEASLEKKDFLLQCHTRISGHQDPGANIISRCARTKSHTYEYMMNHGTGSNVTSLLHNRSSVQNK